MFQLKEYSKKIRLCYLKSQRRIDKEKVLLVETGRGTLKCGFAFALNSSENVKFEEGFSYFSEKSMALNHKILKQGEEYRI